MSLLRGVVRELREERGWLQKDMAEKLGISQGAYSEKERGILRFTPNDRIRLAEIFGISLEELDAKWRSQALPLRPNRGPGIPVINKAPAGVVVDYEEWGVDSGDGYEFIDSGRIRDELAFAVVVVGDSMIPALQDGDIAVFSPFKGVPRPHRKLATGDVCFIRFSAESDRDGCTIARYQGSENGVSMFTKDNPEFEPLRTKNEHIEQLAIGVERRSKM